MDPSYYERQAEQERKRLEGHQRKISSADGALVKAEAAAERAMQAAQRTSSPSMARSKLSEVERRRKDAARAREDRARASAAAASSQAKIHDFEKKAREARARQQKKAADEAKRSADRARREAAEAERAQARERRVAEERMRAQQRELSQLRAATSEVAQQIARARRAAPPQITVLFMAGTIEGGKQPLRLDREIREIVTRLRASEYRDQINLQTAQATQISDILDAFNRHDPDVVHFSGHGDRSSLLFEGPDGRPHELRDDQLALLLSATRRPIRLLVINACSSAEQAVLATGYVEAAIGMEEPINDDTAKVFAGQLYGSLAAGNTLQSAFEQAAVQARVVNDDSRGRPQLYTRAGVDPARVVLVAPPPPASAA